MRSPIISKDTPMNLFARLIRSTQVPTPNEYQALRDVLADPATGYGEARWVEKVREVVATAPVATQLSRLRIVMKEKFGRGLASDLACFASTSVRMAHDRSRLLGPVTPDRELTSEEAINRADFLAPFAFEVIWETIEPQVEQMLADHKNTAVHPNK